MKKLRWARDVKGGVEGFGGETEASKLAVSDDGVEKGRVDDIFTLPETNLGGGFKDFLFSPLFGEDFQFD